MSATANFARPESWPEDQWYRLAGDEVAERLRVDPARGLTAARASELLARNGPNQLPDEPPVPGWRQFCGQYRSYMQLILVGAAIVSLLVQEWGTAAMLVAITILNALVSMRQEGKSESAMNALRSMVKPTARVRRDAVEAEIAAADIVIGDVVLLSAGDDIPADGRILAASSLQIDESALTGESVPVAKTPDMLHGDALAPGDQANMAFMHTPVTHGSGLMMVTGTGASTQVGRIAEMLSATPKEQTPLTRQLNVLTLWIAGAAGFTMACMFVLGAQRGQSSTELLTAAVALAIAAIPEAMPTVLQVVLSLGAADLATHGAIVKDLTSVETLGSTSAINSDKTGTLTLNQMTAVEVVDAGNRYTVSGRGYELEGRVHHVAGAADTIDDAILPYVIASDAALVDGAVVGDPTEGALLVLAHKAGLDVEATRARFPREATLPFDPTNKLMAAFTSMHESGHPSAVRCFVKGAAPAVLERAAAALTSEGQVPWDAELRDRLDAEVVRMESDGLRVMAAGYTDLERSAVDPAGHLLDHVRRLVITSLVGMVDPARAESKDAVHAAQMANIRVRMVTGDDVITGAAIAKQLGIEGEAILGADFAALDEATRVARIEDIGVVGRVAPEHKVLLVDTLKKRHEVVAMTGDGVNDAPAIKAAHIGIAMGSGTEVAKTAGRMILADDNFATIVRAVAQGRKLYDNLTKYIRFVLITLVAFVLMFLGATLLNIAAGQPFSSAQVLWIHFVVSAPFGVVLGLDIETPGLMRLLPRRADESIMTRSLLMTAGLVGLFMAVVLDLLIAFGESQYDSRTVGSSIGLTAFGLMILVAAYESRSVTNSIFTGDTFNSRMLNWTALGEIALALLVTQLDGFGRLLGTVPLTAPQWLLALAPAVLLIGLWELGKLTARVRSS